MNQSENPSPKKPKVEETLQIHWRIDTWFPDLPEKTRQQLKLLHQELLKFNKTVNLIGVKTVSMADAIHFADSILASRIIHKAVGDEEIYDFGSGNGFPGLVYALLHPKSRVIMVDVDGRKAEYLKHAAHQLGLQNTKVLIQTVESLPEQSIRLAMSRGFAPISKAILLSRKHFVKGGRYFHLKSEEWVTEVGQIPTQLCSFWTPGLEGEYKLPIGEVRFAVVRTEKITD